MKLKHGHIKYLKLKKIHQEFMGKSNTSVAVKEVSECHRQFRSKARYSGENDTVGHGGYIS